MLCAGLGVFVLANLGCAAAPEFTTLVLLRVLAGLWAAAVSTTAFAIAVEGAPAGRHGLYLSVVTAGLSVALFTGVPVGAAIAGTWGWRSTFLLVAAVIAAATLPRLPERSPGALADRLAPLRRPAVLRMVVAVVRCGAGGLMFYTYLGPVVVHAAGDDAGLPLLLTVIGIVGVGSALLSGRLTDALGARTARLAVLGGQALALLVLAVGAPLWLLAVGVAWSVFVWALNPPVCTSARRSPERSVG